MLTELHKEDDGTLTAVKFIPQTQEERDELQHVLKGFEAEKQTEPEHEEK